MWGCIVELMYTHTHTQANHPHSSSLPHDTEVTTISEELLVNDSVDDFSDSQCSTMSQDQERSSSTHRESRDSRKEDKLRDKPSSAKKRKYKHHK